MGYIGIYCIYWIYGIYGIYGVSRGFSGFRLLCLPAFREQGCYPCADFQVYPMGYPMEYPMEYPMGYPMMGYPPYVAPGAIQLTKCTAPYLAGYGKIRITSLSKPMNGGGYRVPLLK